jgi:hypothetical protein
MAAFLQSGAMIDAILVLVALEALAFLVLYRFLPKCSAPVRATSGSAVADAFVRSLADGGRAIGAD